MKLKTEIFLFLFITGLLIIIITGGLYYVNAKKSVIAQITNQLESLSEAKKLRLESMLLKKKEELYQIKNNTSIKYNMYLLSREENDEHMRNSYRNLINNSITRALADIPSLKRIHLLNKEGRIVVSSDPLVVDSTLHGIPCRTFSPKGTDTFQAFSKDSNTYLCLSGQLSYQGTALGTVVIESKAEELLTLTGDFTGLGETGETILAQKISEDSAVFITPLRFNKNSFFKIKHDKNKEQVTFKALTGDEKFIERGIDYRGIEVMASTRYINDPEWGIVTKIDVQEAMVPVTKFKFMSYRIALIALIILGAISFIFSWKIVFPINRISQAARRISSGELDLIVSINKNNELGNLAMCFNNMTESLINAQKKLEEKVQEINRSNVALEKFAYIVSHDLKAPLSAIGSLAEIITMENQTKLDEEGKKLLSMLQVKVRQMHDLITGILEYSKIDHSGSVPEKIDLREVIHYIIDTLSPPENVKIEIETELPKITFERVLIIQLFQNLISNAIKYNNKQQKFVKIGCQEESRYYKFYVADNGLGIDERYFHKVFDIFTTLQSKGSGSTGIGLAIVKKIIENKGGTVFLTSTIRQGSTFYFTIPK